MLTENEILSLARRESEAWLLVDPRHTAWLKNGFFEGYTASQKTIPSECIGFAEWIAANSWHHYVNNHGRWRIQGKTMEYSTEELYNIYIESLKQKP